METKEKLETLMDGINPKKESFFFLLVKDGELNFSGCVGNYEDIEAAFKKIVMDSMDSDAPSEVKLIGAAIAGAGSAAIEDVIFDDVDDDDDDDDDDCATCPNMRTCELEAAIAYRKENGIPKPKKGKKANKTNEN